MDGNGDVSPIVKDGVAWTAAAAVVASTSCGSLCHQQAIACHASLSLAVLVAPVRADGGRRMRTRRRILRLHVLGNIASASPGRGANQGLRH